MAKKNDSKKFSLPSAKMLRFNPKGKSVEAIPNDDRAYLATKGFYGPFFDIVKSDQEVANFAFMLKLFDWQERTEDVRESANRAFAASVASVGSIEAWQQQRAYEPFFASYQQGANVKEGGQI
jgi:hypothetical protein